MKTYTLSYYRTVKQPRLRKRAWWNLFGRDSIEMEGCLERVYIQDVPEDEATILMGKYIGSHPCGRLINRIIGDGVSFLQLEDGSPATQYQSVTAKEE